MEATEPKTQTIEVTIQAADPYGNDPLEATAHLPIIPRRGDLLNVWCKARDGWPDRQEYLTVTEVAISTYWPEDIKVVVSTDGHSDQDIQDIFMAIRERHLP